MPDRSREVLADVRIGDLVERSGGRDPTPCAGISWLQAVSRPYPECGGVIEKMQYLGGACYYCPNCQE